MCCSKTYSQLLPDDMGDQTRDYVHSHLCPFHWHTDLQLSYSCGSCREAAGSQALLKIFVHIIHKYVSISRPYITSDTTMILMQHLCLESVTVLKVCFATVGCVFSWLSITIKQSHVPRAGSVEGDNFQV